jgi:hypothetical protein
MVTSLIGRADKRLAPPHDPQQKAKPMTRKSHTIRSMVDTILRGAVDPNVVVCPVARSVDGDFRSVPIMTVGSGGMRTRCLYRDDGGDLEAYRVDFLRALVERPVTVHNVKTVCEAVRRVQALWPGVDVTLVVEAAQ